MLKEQRTYFIVCLAIVSISIFAVNIFAGAALTRFTGYIWIATGFCFIITLISNVAHVILRSIKSYRITVIILCVFLSLNSILIKEVFEMEIHKFKIAQIEKIDTCEKAELQFDIDLKNQSLKYFTFGMGVDEEHQKKLEDKYNLEVYHMGCIVENSYECYNELVNKHLKMKSISLSNKESDRSKRSDS